ncbi:MAG: HPr(Ser) kinase/phosphatase [Erysipelotrichaceae bacterium]|nr:HPr(Ser) kinase/phosphatase [Erysipelotrichaceae bacterium]
MNLEFEGRVTIKEILDHFGYEHLVGNEDSLKRWVVVPDVNRPGLELTGFFEHTEPRRVLIIGAKEESYLATLDEKTQKERFENILDGFTPALILTMNRECPKVLKEVAENRNFPIFRSPHPTFRVMTDLITFLDSKLAPQDTLHGVLLSVYGKGVLIVGESGMGKSEIALELIRRGHVLVADDRVDVARIHNKITGHAPELLEGMLEIRGVGVIDVAKMFGGASLLEDTEVHLVIHLEKYIEDKVYNRVGTSEEQFYPILGLNIPLVTLPVSEGRSMGVLIEAVVTNFRLKERGFNSSKEFEQRVYDYIERQNQLNKLGGE